MMLYRILAISLLALVGGARGEQAFFTFDGFSGFYGSGGVPDDAFKSLAKVSQDGKAELKCFAFAMNGDWVYLFGGTGYFSNNVNLPVCKKLTELQKGCTDLRCVAFAPSGGWTILSGGNGSWTEGTVPEAAVRKIAEVGKQGADLRSIAYGAKGAWVLLYNKRAVAFGDVPKSLADVLHNAVKKRLIVHCVAFTGNDWICLTNNGWWTSNLDLPATKTIAKAIKDGHSPKWVAVVPAFAEHNFEKWSAYFHRTLDGKLAGGYAFLVLKHGKVAASGAEGWARAPWEKENASLKWSLDTPMQLASVSKTITAVAMLKLWEDSQKTDRKFSLDDPFWPHIRKISPTAHASVKQVTIRQLLMHRSGFIDNPAFANITNLEKVLNLPTAQKPGTSSNYSNFNYYLLHFVLEQIGQVRYTPYVKERILQPMGITKMDTHYKTSELALGYSKEGKQKPGHPWDMDAKDWAGPGGWFASATDLGRFLEGVRKHKVLSKATTELMLKENLGWDGSDPGWSKNGGVFHNGQMVLSKINLFPDGIVSVYLTNCEPPSAEDLNATAWLNARGK